MTIHLKIQSGCQIPYPTPTFVSLFHIFAPTSISDNAWDTSKLLLLSSDVKINSGPRPVDTNSVFCTICSSKINRGIQQETAPTCNAQCHQACNGITINQTHHAKSCGRNITWKCPQHGTDIAEFIMRPPPVYEIPNPPSATGKLCSVCKNPIRSCYADLAYHCADRSCNNVCYLAATCSSFAYPKGTTRARLLSTRIWHRHLHSSTIPSVHPSTQADTSSACPTPPSLNSLLNQGMSLADTKNCKQKCAKCFAAVGPNTVPVICSICKKGFH